MLGIAYAAQGEHRKAIGATRAALEVSPNDLKAHFYIGKSFFEFGELAPAISAFSKAAAFDPDFAEAHYWIGRCYRVSQDFSEEFEAYLMAVRINGQYLDALLALGTAYARREGQPDENFDYVDGTGVFKPNEPDQQFYLGLGFLAMRELRLACRQVFLLSDMDSQLTEMLAEFIDRDDDG